jgi:hypothetical protein
MMIENGKRSKRSRACRSKAAARMDARSSFAMPPVKERGVCAAGAAQVCMT